MKKLFMYLGLTLVLIVGFAITVNNASAINTSPQAAVTQLSPPELAYQELKNKALAKIGEGWLYMKDSQKFDVDPPMEKGDVPLVDTTTDYWYYINSSGYVERFVTITRTMDGQTQQVGIYSNGTGWNTMVDEIEPMEPFFFDSFDYGLPYGFKSPDFKSNNITLNGGSDAVEFTYTIMEEKPLDAFFYSASAPLVSTEYDYIFNSATGFFVSSKTIAHLEDGTQRVLLHVQMEQIKFNAEPPADVLKYFELKKAREAQK